jgi:hypothetical protein
MTAVWVAIAAGIPALFAAVIGMMNRSKIAEVHVLVNSKMSEALATIASLRTDAAVTALARAAEAQQSDHADATAQDAVIKAAVAQAQSVQP